MRHFGLVVIAASAIGCGSDGVSNELGEATVTGEVMGESFNSNAIAWHATVAGAAGAIISIHETGTACSTSVSSGNNLRISFGCALEPGSFTVVADGSGNCPDQILATLDTDGEATAFGSGGTIDLDMDETSLFGSFDIDFGEESLSGSFNLRDCGEVTPN